MVSGKTTEAKITNAKKTITAKDVFIKDGFLTDENGENIIAKIAEELPNGDEVFSFKISIELEENYEDELDDDEILD